MNRYERHTQEREDAAAKERAAQTLQVLIGDKRVSAGPEPTWKTRDGRTIPISTMSDSHLMSSLAMCERRGWFKASIGFLKIEARRRGLR